MYEQHGPVFSLVGFILLATLGSLLFSDVTPTSNRPNDREYLSDISNMSSVPARLWQDPFNAYYQARNNSNSVEPSAFTTQIAKVVSQSHTESYTGDNTIVLGVMVSTSPYASIRERRRIYRYSTVTALNRAKFTALKTEEIQMAGMKHLIPPATSPKADTASEQSGTFVLPYEWYQSASGKKVLLLWLDEQQFLSAPLNAMAQLNANLQSAFGTIPPNSKSQPKLKIIGPSDSGVLQTMLLESSKPPSNQSNANTSVVEIYSPFATVPATLFKKNEQSEYYSSEVDLKNKIDAIAVNQVKFRFHRTILADSEIAKALVNELKVRRIEAPQIDDCKNQNIPVCLHQKGTVVLISELDTQYGRALTESFKQNFCEAPDHCPQLLQFSYLRGIDGITAGVSDVSTPEESNAKNETESLLALDGDRMHRATGASQFDYIDRLGKEMSFRHQQLAQHNRKGIVAIGLLGTDVYDRLVILKTLRHRFPHAIFFTSDANAQWLHAKDYPWTRNLIVASSYGLKLNPLLQKEVPPFRSSYQSAVFVSTLLAVAPQELPFSWTCGSSPCSSDEMAEKLLHYVSPVIWEVGRKGPVRLVTRNEANITDTRVLNYLPTQNQIATQISFALFYAIVVLFFGGFLLNYCQFDKQHMFQSLWTDHTKLATSVIISYALLTAVVIGVNFKTPEPFSLVDGISIWPAIYLRAALLLACCTFIANSLNVLNRHNQRLESAFQLPRKQQSADQSPPVLARLFLNLWVPMLMVIICAGLIAVFLTTETSLAQFNIWMPIASITLAIWVATTWYNKVSRLADWDTKTQSENTCTKSTATHYSLDTLWADYQHYGSTSQTTIRVSTNTLIYIIFFMCLWMLCSESPPPLFRGGTFLVMMPIMILSTISMLYVLFYVVDVTRQCRIWIRALGRESLTVESHNLEHWNSKLDTPQLLTIAMTKIDLIGWRTKHVSHMIYFPFIAILLMLLSTSNYFDNWVFPTPLGIMLTINVGICTINAFQLRSAAEKTRLNILRSLRQAEIASAAANDASAIHSEQLQKVTQMIQARNDGAFRPLLQQPIVKAFIFLIGGIGFALTQYTNMGG
ncbi:hypothetical protein [Echinimonas agarilytica]|uniref:Uncharacterized protein n=1 Tax=Echinimonas agarilytica TaxID=1215918 RepID=A0AA41W4K7_9GAMM|nr:hypothetical protein [Echinimonas agarilytica]MCM2678735.1 hypothetical protein [Echinimonas agarilytica]